MKNKVGPKIERWGTPYEMMRGADMKFSLLCKVIGVAGKLLMQLQEQTIAGDPLQEDCVVYWIKRLD